MLPRRRSQPSILSLLHGLPDSNEFKVTDLSVVQGAKWIVNYCLSNSEKARALVGSGDGGEKEEGETEMEKRKRLAKERALKSMQNNVAKFLDMLDGESDDDMEVEEEKKKSKGPEFLGDRPRCIICNEEPDGSPLEYCALVHPSTVLSGGGPVKGGQEIDDRFVGCQVSLCGHCVHPGCFDEFFAGIVSQRHARSSLDTSKGEYYCPLCKAVCNAAVPVVDRIKINPSESSYTSFEALLSFCRGKTLKSITPVVEESAAKSMSLSRFSQPTEVPAGQGSAIKPFTDAVHEARLQADVKRLSWTKFKSPDLQHGSRALGNYRSHYNMYLDAEPGCSFAEFLRVIRSPSGLPLQAPQVPSGALWQLIHEEHKEQQERFLSLKQFNDWLSAVDSLAYTLKALSTDSKRKLLGGHTRVTGVEGLWIKNLCVVLSKGALEGEGKLGKIKALATSLQAAGGAYFPVVVGTAFRPNGTLYPVMLSSISTLATAMITGAVGTARSKVVEVGSSVGSVGSVPTIVGGTFVARMAQCLLGSFFDGGDALNDTAPEREEMAKKAKSILQCCSRMKPRTWLDAVAIRVLGVVLVGVLKKLGAEDNEGDSSAMEVDGEEEELKAVLDTTATLSLHFLTDLVLVLQVSIPGYLESLGNIVSDEEEGGEYGEVGEERGDAEMCKLVLEWMGCGIEAEGLEGFGREMEREVVLGWLDELKSWEIGRVPLYTPVDGVSHYLGLWESKRAERLETEADIFSSLSFTSNSDSESGGLGILGSSPSMVQQGSPSSPSLMGLGVGPLKPSGSAGFDADTTPLLGFGSIPPQPAIPSMPRSYTSLYSAIKAKNSAVCLTCGGVFDSGGGGALTAHAQTCGCGVGLFFLIGDCTGLLISGQLATYLPSPYVDEHNETPVFRGKPLSLSSKRWEEYENLYWGHGVKDKVYSERRNATRTIIMNHY